MQSLFFACPLESAYNCALECYNEFRMMEVNLCQSTIITKVSSAVPAVP